MTTWRRVGVVAAALLALSLAALAAAILLTREPPALRGDAAKSIVWQTDAVTLAADALAIDAAGIRFTGVGQAIAIHGDPGDREYWTLELEWVEQGVEQRLYLYFAADETAWWIKEIRTYDGGKAGGGEWATYPPGPYARTPIGRVWVGDLDVTGTGRLGPVHLRLTGVALRVGS